MNDIVGVNLRTFELAGAGAAQVIDFKEDLARLFKPGEEVIAYQDLGELRQQLDYYLARPDEARAVGEMRAGAPWPSTRSDIASTR